MKKADPSKVKDNRSSCLRVASVVQFKSQFSAFLKASEAGPVVVIRNGKAVAVLVGVQDDDEIERLFMAYSPRLQAILDASRKQVREEQVLGQDEFWKEVGAARESKSRGRKRKSRRTTRPN